MMIRYEGLVVKALRILRSNTRSVHVVRAIDQLDQDPYQLSMPLGSYLLSPYLAQQSNWKDKVAFFDGATNASLTFSQTHDNIVMTASKLKKMGARRGFGVAIISTNHMNFFTVLAATTIVGAHSISINPLCSEAELLYQLELADAKVIFAHSLLLEKILPTSRKLGIPVYALNDGDSVVGTLSQLISDEHIDRIDGQSLIPKDFSPEDIAVIPFSSGTTGKSKGVMLTNRNLIANVIQSRSRFEGSEAGNYSTLIPIPFYHIYGMVTGMFIPFNAGRKLIYLPQFELKKYLELVQEHKVKRSYIVPPIILQLAKHPIVDHYDLSSLEWIVSAAAPLGAEVQDACSARLNCKIKQAWGMTELSPIGTVYSDEDIISLVATQGKSGKLIPGTEGKVVCPETGADLPPHVEGEIMIRGPQVMKGYLKNKEATSATIRPDGWLHTGDIGYFDNEGALVITDRSKELIKYKGFQVPPAELEALILTMPEVKDAIVIPVLDDEAGEIPRAYVVKNENCPVDFNEETVARFVNSKVSPQKKLRGGVKFTDSIPKSASGKLLRRLQVQIDRGISDN